MEEEFYSEEVPKEQLRKGTVYKNIYGRQTINKPKYGEAPAHLKVLPELEWQDNKPKYG
jgi:hypothetical protein